MKSWIKLYWVACTYTLTSLLIDTTIFYILIKLILNIKVARYALGNQFTNPP